MNELLGNEGLDLQYISEVWTEIGRELRIENVLIVIVLELLLYVCDYEGYI
jgi:hypothetical protein